MIGIEQASRSDGVRRGARLRRGCLTAVYVALAGWLVYRVAQFHDAREGFTPLIRFGQTFASRRLPALGTVPVHTYPTGGYDGQFYAQIAVAGNPFDPELRLALDVPSHRLRRVLMPEVAHLLGLGRPDWVLTAYALSNLACWLVLAWLLARWWFPPGNIHDLLRWIAVMFGAGLLVSVSRSLTDGPAVLLVAAGVHALERGRRRLAAGVLCAAGLVRETSILAASAFVPPAGPAPRAWRKAWLAAGLCALPVVSWSAVLLLHLGAPKVLLDTAFAGLAGELRRLPAVLETMEEPSSRKDLVVLLATLVQVGFLLGRPRPALPWWRVGVSFAVLSLFFGWDWWKDPVNGIPRTLLPLALAFNLLVPRTRGGLVLLLLGNLTVLYAPEILTVPPGVGGG